jgi:predicted outer membrane repeat protein
MAFTDNESKNDGGAVYYNGKGNKGGAAFIDGNAEIENLVCSGNSSLTMGDALHYHKIDTTYIDYALDI